jgi:polyhydroxyalkanoate synthase
VGSSPADTVLKENKWRRLRYRTPAGVVRRGKPVVLVPSLINRHYVLDLLPQKSFAEYMVKRGHDVYIIDWGTPTDEDRFVTFDDVADRYVGRALRVAAKLGDAPNVHVLGYCLGGTLAVIQAALHPNRCASLTALAAPRRFAFTTTGSFPNGPARRRSICMLSSRDWETFRGSSCNRRFNCCVRP